MALIKCDECGKEISNQAKTCPNCGFPLKKPKKRTVNKKVLILVLLICVILGAGAAYILLRPADNEALIQLSDPKLKLENIEDILGKSEDVSYYDNVTVCSYRNVDLIPGVESEFLSVDFKAESNELFSWMLEVSPESIDEIIKFLDDNFISKNDGKDYHHYITNEGDVYGEISVDDHSVYYRVRR